MSSERKRARPLPAILMGLALILVCYSIQIATKKYIPLVYWLAVTAVAMELVPVATAS